MNQDEITLQVLLLEILREDLEFTKQELADRIGVSRSQYSMFELGKGTLKIQAQLALAKELGITMEVLYGLTQSSDKMELLKERKIAKLQADIDAIRRT